MEPTPKDILATRFAKGELTIEEYKATLNALDEGAKQQQNAVSPTLTGRPKNASKGMRLGIALALLCGVAGILFVLAKSWINSDHVISMVKVKALHVADKDYPLSELIMRWDPKTQKLSTGQVFGSSIVDGATFRTVDTTWTAKENPDGTYLVSARSEGRTYTFTVDVTSQEVKPASDTARELFELPQRSFGTRR